MVYYDICKAHIKPKLICSDRFHEKKVKHQKRLLSKVQVDENCHLLHCGSGSNGKRETHREKGSSEGFAHRKGSYQTV